jgi:hypothetical protein
VKRWSRGFIRSEHWDARPAFRLGSTEPLIHFLNLPGQDVVIVVKPAKPNSGQPGQVRVVAEAIPRDQGSVLVRECSG